MKLVNTYISDNCSRKCLVYVDRNGHYEIVRWTLTNFSGWNINPKGQTKFKHIESLNRAVKKWLSC